MTPRAREQFDAQVERVLAEMPPIVQNLLQKVPMHVEDYPSDDVMDSRGVEYIDELCGLYTGIPITQRSINDSGVLDDFITIYREGILSAAAGADGRITRHRLREQIRITILHELGHHNGLSEGELSDLGYG